MAQDSTTLYEDEQQKEYKDKLEMITGGLETPVSSERKCKLPSGGKPVLWRILYGVKSGKSKIW